MKELAQAIGSILWMLLILALVFLFYGEPDLWDRWHALAMGSECSAVESIR
jgi:hypothetical protein